MDYRTLTEQDYLKAGEAFHVARRTLEPGPIRLLHDHDYFELFWVDGGRLTHQVNGVDLIMDVGDGAWIRPADRHGFSPASVGPCRLVNVMFRAETAAHLRKRYEADLAGRHCWWDGPTPRAVRFDAQQQSVLDRWTTELEAGPRSLARIEGFLLGLLNRMIPTATDPLPDVPSWLADAIEAVRRPALFRMGAKGLVVAANRSHEHVCRALRSLLATTPSALVNRIRMDHAAHLLSDTDLPVGRIALECGLENQSHFHALFRRQFGLTPSRYRRIHQRDPVQPDRMRAGG